MGGGKFYIYIHIHTLPKVNLKNCRKYIIKITIKQLQCCQHRIPEYFLDMCLDINSISNTGLCHIHCSFLFSDKSGTKLKNEQIELFIFNSPMTNLNNLLSLMDKRVFFNSVHLFINNTELSILYIWGLVKFILSERFLEVEILCRRRWLLIHIAKLLSKKTMPIDTPTSNRKECRLVHTLAFPGNHYSSWIIANLINKAEGNFELLSFVFSFHMYVKLERQ